MVEVKKEYKELGIFVILILFAYLLIPVISLFVLSGITENIYKDKFTIYGIIAGGMLIGAITLKVLQIVLPNFWFRFIIHDPEESSMVAGIYNKSKFLQTILKPFNLFAISFTIFITLGMFAVATNTFFIGAPIVEGIEAQQITPANQFLFAIEPTVSTENMLFNFILSLMVGLIFFLKSKYKIAMPLIIVMFLIAILIFGLGWLALHNARYGGSEISLFNAFTFGVVGGFITLLTGSIIPFLVYHWMNNGFYVLFKVLGLSSDVIIIGAVIILLSFLTVFGLSKLIKRQLTKTPSL